MLTRKNPMTISAKTLSAIQTAGQALDTARADLAMATQEHAARVMQAVAENPFGAENDHLFNRWKAIARMAQSVQDMEAQCKAVFQAAGELAMDTHGQEPARRGRKPSMLGHATIDLAPSDVQEKPRRGRKPKAATQRPLKGNAAKVLEQLRTQLNNKRFTRTTQSDIASAAGIPNGSIAAALKQLVDKGIVVEGERGHYKLA